VLRAAAPFSALQEHICELYGLLERQLGAQDGAPQPDADVCELVLPHYELAKRWREALALPHVQPSAECFSRAIERECNLEAWLRIAETRSDARGARDGANGARDGANGAHENARRAERRAERRTAAIARWREHVLVGAPGTSAVVGACGREAPLRAALRSVLQLEALSPSSEGTQQERLEDQLLKTLLKGTPTTAPIGTRATPAASSAVASPAPATAPVTTMPTAEARAMVAALPRGVASKIAYHQLGREALERAAALVRRAQGEIEIGRAQGEIEIGRAQGEASGSGGGGGIGGVGKARALGTARRLDGGAYSALVRG
jgi:hypothetical protein